MNGQTFVLLELLLRLKIKTVFRSILIFLVVGFPISLNPFQELFIIYSLIFTISTRTFLVKTKESGKVPAGKEEVYEDSEEDTIIQNSK